MREAESLFQARSSRRDFIKRASALGVVAVSGFEFTRRSTENETINRIRRLEEDMAEKPLTFEEVKAYVPVVADLFVKSVPTDLTVKEIKQSTFILQDKFNVEEDQEGDHLVTFSTGEALNSRTIEQLFIDYPGINIPYSVAQGILEDVYENKETLAFVSRPLPEVYKTCSYLCGTNESEYPRQIFIFLNRINNAAAFQLPRFAEQTPLLQFDDFDHQVDCRMQQPAVGFRSTFIHELVHFDTDSIDQGIWYGGEGVSGFSVMAMFYPNAGALEEFVADYFPARISAFNDLPFRTGYSHEPHDFVNFQRILAQSGISDIELYRLHKSSGLLPFLDKLTDKAQHGDFKSRKEFYRLKNDLFDMLTGEGTESFSPDWKKLQSYFPSVDVNEYQYFDPSSDHELSANQRLGCIRS